MSIGHGLGAVGHRNDHRVRVFSALRGVDSSRVDFLERADPVFSTLHVDKVGCTVEVLNSGGDSVGMLALVFSLTSLRSEELGIFCLVNIQLDKLPARGYTLPTSYQLLPTQLTSANLSLCKSKPLIKLPSSLLVQVSTCSLQPCSHAVCRSLIGSQWQSSSEKRRSMRRMR